MGVGFPKVGRLRSYERAALPHLPAEQLLALRQAVKAAVTRCDPPPDLEQRVRASLRSTRRWIWMPAIAASLVLLFAFGVARSGLLRGSAANMLERAAFHLDSPRDIVLEGTLVCRDCELHDRYGARTMCDLKGHHGALETADGKIWNLMEGESSDALIHNRTMIGKKLLIRGRIFREAGCVQVESYEIRS